MHADVLHIFSGRTVHGSYQCGRNETLRACLEAFGEDKYVDIAVHEIDYLNCDCFDAENKRPSQHPCCGSAETRCCNLMRDRIFERLLAECRKGKYRAIVAGIPCNGYCVARFLEDGNARPLRDRQHPLGLPPEMLRPCDRQALAMSNTLTLRGLMLCLAVWESGGEALIENPIDRGVFGLWGKQYNLMDAATQSRHCPLWATPWFRMYAEAVGIAPSTLLHFAQCALMDADFDFQKYTTLAPTPHWASASKAAFSIFENKACTCKRGHRRQARGRDDSGHYVSAEAATYPLKMNQGIARAVIQYLLAPRADDTSSSRREAQATVQLWQTFRSPAVRAACKPATAGMASPGCIDAVSGLKQPTITNMLLGESPPTPPDAPPPVVSTPAAFGNAAAAAACVPCNVDAATSPPCDVWGSGQRGDGGNDRKRRHLCANDPEDEAALARHGVPADAIDYLAEAYRSGPRYTSAASAVLKAFSMGLHRIKGSPLELAAQRGACVACEVCEPERVQRVLECVDRPCVRFGTM